MLYFLKSFVFFISNLFVKRKYDIIFYYPIHFNRGKNGENPFLAPLFSLCKHHGLRYLIIEEPVLFSKTSYKRNSEAVPFDFVLLVILALRKAIPPGRFATFQEKEWLIAKVLKPMFFARFRFNNYVVLSQSMLSFFRGLEPSAKLFDYQHGVITSSHPGYVTANKEAPANLKLNKACVMVYGEGFKEVLLKATTDGYYNAHAFPVGIRLPVEFKDHSNEKIIFFALQFKDFSPEIHRKMLERIVQFLKALQPVAEKNGIEVVLKNHPRFNKNISLEPLTDFSFTTLEDINLFELIEKSFLHITFSSTTVFESAASGVPSILLENRDLDLPWELNPEFFEDDFGYITPPLNIEKSVETIKTYLYDKTQYNCHAEAVHEWYQKYYAPLMDERIIDLLIPQERVSCA
ncbi:hypothetical protein [Hydrogenimonas sp.]